MVKVGRLGRGWVVLVLATVAWLASGTPVLAAWTRVKGFNGPLSAGEITACLIVMAAVVAVVVIACLRKYNYQLQHDGDRLIFWYKGDSTAKVALTDLARVRLAPRGGQAMFVERDGTTYHTTDPVAPELLRALDANGVAVEGRPDAG